MDGVDKHLRRYPGSRVVADVLGTVEPNTLRSLARGLDPEIWPNADEALAFIGEYEAASRRSFDDEERRSAHGACVDLRAYAARCGHAFGADARRESGLADFAEALL